MSDLRIWLALALAVSACAANDGGGESPGSGGPPAGQPMSGFDLAGGQSGTENRGSLGPCRHTGPVEDVALDALPLQGTRTPNQIFPAFEGTRTYDCGEVGDGGVKAQQVVLEIRRGAAARSLVGRRDTGFGGAEVLGAECRELVLDAEVTLRLNGEKILEAHGVRPEFNSYAAVGAIGSVLVDGRSYAVTGLTMRNDGTELWVSSEHPTLFLRCQELAPSGPFDRCATDFDCATSDHERELLSFEDCGCQSFCNSFAMTATAAQRRFDQYTALCWSNREAFDPSSCEVGPCSRYGIAVCRSGVCTFTTDIPSDGGVP